MSDLNWHNAKAEIIFNIGVNASASIISLNEKYTDGSDCDSVLLDLVDEGAQTILDCMDIDASKEGTFVAQVLVKCHYDESPDYKLESVNAYDPNQELIAKQAETIAKRDKDIELLRGALNVMVGALTYELKGKHYTSYDGDANVTSITDNAKEALAATYTDNTPEFGYEVRGRGE